VPQEGQAPLVRGRQAAVQGSQIAAGQAAVGIETQIMVLHIDEEEEQVVDEGLPTAARVSRHGDMPRRRHGLDAKDRRPDLGLGQQGT
jgi:hypothetical protein